LPASHLLKAVDLEAEEGHDLLKMLVVPRPIAWVTTLRPNDVVNLAPFASFTILGFGPMTVGLAIARVKVSGHKKDTLRNIELNREFVIHTVTEDMMEQVVSTARAAPADESKALTAGLTLVDSSVIRVPRISDCAAAMECRCQEILRIGTSHELVVATVEAVHMDPKMFPGGEPDYTRFRPLGRMHGEYFARMGDIVHAPRRTGS
jgi:flavin reductase (DIM6/NTAB) family NADH-FMN oxidoreductase RutF